MWTDSHCHLDAAEFDADRAAVLGRAAAAEVARIVLPAVERANFDTVRRMAGAAVAEHAEPAGRSGRAGFTRPRLAYALGIHPLYVARATEEDLEHLDAELTVHHADPHLVAVGEIGLDHFVPGLDPALQERFYTAQLKLARQHALPVIVHVRRSADALLKGLRRVPVSGGIVHAFNGSRQQAEQFVAMGFALGFGGAMTFERALQIRELARVLPMHALALETDAPDIPPQWLYRRAKERQAGAAQGRNEPAELPRLARTLAALRGMDPDNTTHLTELAALTSANVCRVLPRLK